MNKKTLYDISIANFVPNSAFNIVPVIDTKEGFKIGHEGIITTKGSLKARRSAVKEFGKLGSDLYLDITEQTVADKFRFCATTFEDGTITSKNYYLLKEPTNREKETLSKKDLILLSSLLKESTKVYITEEPDNISFTMPANTKSKVEYMVDFDAIVSVIRYGLAPTAPKENNPTSFENIVSKGINQMPFKNWFDVYSLTNNKLTKTNLDEALDKPKTVLDKTKPTNLKGTKMHLFYEYDPAEGYHNLPSCLSKYKANPTEFEYAGFTEDDKLIWKKTSKIIQNNNSSEYAEDVYDKGNMALIEITGPHEKEILDELEKINKLGQVREFEEYHDPSLNKKFEYYTSNNTIIKTNFITDEVLEKAIAYWAQKLEWPSQEEMSEERYKSDKYLGLLNGEELSDEEIDNFKTSLFTILKRESLKNNNDISVTSSLLKEALNNANITLKKPLNGVMWITKDTITVRSGIDGTKSTIYTKRKLTK